MGAVWRSPPRMTLLVQNPWRPPCWTRTARGRSDARSTLLSEHSLIVGGGRRAARVVGIAPVPRGQVVGARCGQHRGEGGVAIAVKGRHGHRLGAVEKYNEACRG